MKQVMRELHERFPSDMEYEIGLDTTRPVTEGIREIATTIGEAILLVILVVFLFLQNWRATLIPLIAVPVSLVGTFIFFPFLGFSTSAQKRQHMWAAPLAYAALGLVFIVIAQLLARRHRGAIPAAELL